MTPVMQTVFGAPGGNCFAACVATVLDLDISVVPNFFEGAQTAKSCWTNEDWQAVKAFGEFHGFKACWLDPDLADDVPYVRDLLDAGIHYIATGKSPRGDHGHCVVMLGSEFVHDPHPAGKFIEGSPWLYVFFIRE